VATQLSAGCVSCLAQDPDLAPSQALSSCEAGRSSTDYVYSGNTGLVLALGKIPVRTDTFLLPSENVARGVIHARLEDPPVDVYCTHFTARGELPSRAEWERVSAQQVEVLLREIATRSGEGPVAVLGDLNFGADAAAFGELEQSRFESSYAKRDGRCTLCAAGPRFVIDHVLTRDPLRVHRVDRVWDQDELSDHHGVQVAVTLPIRS
jgi:endonuclease/exonuclease/phosphatase family metal-dependent hydrolase